MEEKKKYIYQNPVTRVVPTERNRTTLLVLISGRDTWILAPLTALSGRVLAFMLIECPEPEELWIVGLTALLIHLHFQHVVVVNSVTLI